MLKLQGKLPRHLFVACSGGVDSMAVLDFLSRNHGVTIAFFDHGTEASHEAQAHLAHYSSKNNIDFLYGTCNRKKQSDESWEEYWRNERYNFFHSINGIVVTGHHLDDVVETWLWSSLHGTGKIIPYENKNVIRPFRLTRKRDFELWCNLKNVPVVEDKSNEDISFTRNYIRHVMMPNVLKVNPGIHKVIAKKVKADEYQYSA